MAEIKIMTLAAQQYYDEKIKAFIKSEDDKLANGQVKTNTEAIAAINNADTGILAQAKKFASEEDVKVQDSVNALADKVGEVPEGSTVMGIIQNIQENAYDDTELVDRIDVIDGKVDVLIGDDSNKSVRTIANEELAKQLIADGAKEAMDTLGEIAAWIQSHPDDASAMNKAIEDLEALVGVLPEDVTAATIVGYVQEIVAAEKSRAEGVEADLEGRLATVEGNIGAGTVDSRIATAKSEAISEAAADATSKANAAQAAAEGHADSLNTAMNTRVEALEAIDHDHANKAELDLIASGDKAKWDEAYAKRHEHSNLTVLEGITSDKVSAWDAAEGNAKTYADGLNSAMDERVAAVEEWKNGFVEVTDEEIDGMFA